MQLRAFLRIPVFILVLMAGICVSAKVIPPRPFFFDREITVNGAVVPEGMYSLYLETHGSSVRATLRKDGRFVANGSRHVGGTRNEVRRKCSAAAGE